MKQYIHCATSLLERGTDTIYIQKIFGNESIKTTEIYTHITDVKKAVIISTLDYIDMGDYAKTNVIGHSMRP